MQAENKLLIASILAAKCEKYGAAVFFPDKLKGVDAILLFKGNKKEAVLEAKIAFTVPKKQVNDVHYITNVADVKAALKGITANLQDYIDLAKKGKKFKKKVKKVLKEKNDNFFPDDSKSERPA